MTKERMQKTTQQQEFCIRSGGGAAGQRPAILVGLHRSQEDQQGPLHPYRTTNRNILKREEYT
jgi:hypothetical protein